MGQVLADGGHSWWDLQWLLGTDAGGCRLHVVWEISNGTGNLFVAMKPITIPNCTGERLGVERSEVGAPLSVTCGVKSSRPTQPQQCTLQTTNQCQFHCIVPIIQHIFSSLTNEDDEPINTNNSIVWMWFVQREGHTSNAKPIMAAPN